MGICVCIVFLFEFSDRQNLEINYKHALKIHNDSFTNEGEMRVFIAKAHIISCFDTPSRRDDVCKIGSSDWLNLKTVRSILSSPMLYFHPLDSKRIENI